MRLNCAPPPVAPLESTELTVRSMSEKTPMPLSTSHSTATMATPAMPRATEMRNDIFITDHGSARETVSLTRRGPVIAGRAAPAAVPPAAEAPAGTGWVAPAAGLSAPGRGPVPSAPAWGRDGAPVLPAVLTRYLQRCPRGCPATLRYPAGSPRPVHRRRR